MARQISSATTLEHIRKDAKRWLKALHAGDADARARLERASPHAPSTPTLRDVQHALAREYGHDSWIALKAALAQLGASKANDGLRGRTAVEYEALAHDTVAAFNARDDAALQRLNAAFDRAFTFEDLWAEVWRRTYSFRQRAFKQPTQELYLEEARLLIAQDAGFGSWDALQQAIATGAPPVTAFQFDLVEQKIGPRRHLTSSDWDRLIATMKEHRIPTLHANGLMTDAVLARVAALDFVTSLSLGGSRQLSDDGLLHMARMPQLEELELHEYPGGRLTDRGLEVLRHLPNLKRFEMTWQRGITDAGVSNLRFCDRLEQVNLMGTPTGNGAIEALQGKARLHRFSTGRLVTDEALPLLHNIPMLKTWHGPEAIADDQREEPNVGQLLIDGPFTNAGLASLAGLEGVANLDLFWHVTGLTADAFASLMHLPNLMVLGADGELSNDTAMRHIAAIPRLRRLRAQGTTATDDGFEALSHSQTLQSLWTRETPYLGNRGFVALSKLPSLRGMGVSLKHVDDAALSLLPRFPSLRELTPIDVTDSGFRHVGRSEQLTRLTCMYCRETTDVATAHIERLPITFYYAGLTQITDRSLAILGRMPTLEQIELYECKGVTDAGLPALATLPRLREIHLNGLPGVTLTGTRVFPSSVRVRYGT
jgi:hypothetical protein